MREYRQRKEWRKYRKDYAARPATKTKRQLWGHHWYLKYKNEYNAQRISQRQMYRNTLFDILGGAKCIKCGFTDKRALQLDHKQGDGTRKMHMEELKDHHRYLKYIDNPELARKTFQVLCANCNSIKRYEHYKSPLSQIRS
jgi:hypothetical protein